MAGIVAPNIVTEGLVLYLDAANTKSYPGSGTTWSDLSRSGNNGTLTNGPTFNSGNGGSIVFDGTNDYVTTTTNLGANPLPIHTISIWFKTSLASGKKLIGIEDQQTGILSTLNDRQIYMGTNGKIYYGVYDTAARTITSISTLTDNLWHQAVGVCTGANQILLYIDGVLNSSGVGNGYALYTTSYIRIANYLVGSTWTNGTFQGYYTGNISQTSIYNRALSAQEVLQNYNATKGRFGL
jgi:predicted heme/steroid binding protein